jgi:photosystem II stability/assembly factor-like uncharacterized protein
MTHTLPAVLNAKMGYVRSNFYKAIYKKSNNKECQKMSQPESKDKSMRWMWAMMVACCAVPLTIAFVAGGGLGIWLGRSNQQPTSTQQNGKLIRVTQHQGNSKVTLTSAQNWQVDNHIHGLVVNPENPRIIYVASHNGLLQRSESGQWFWVGKDRSDFMGFTGDRKNSQRFYASGHPSTGGNLGFRVSENSGEDWQEISMNGVDFHALGISPSNPSVLYGLAVSGQSGLFVSTDGGKAWQKPRMVGLADLPFDLVVDPEQPDRVLATTRSGIYESTNGGNDWKAIAETQNTPIIALNLVKQGDQTVMYGYRFDKSSPGVYRSNDNGKNWEKLWTETDGAIVKLAVAPSNSQILYAVNEKNQAFQSQDSGKTWKILS